MINYDLMFTLQGELSCSSTECEDTRALSVLTEIIKMAADSDLNRPEIRALELDTAESQVATVNFVGGPVVPRPPEGWTAAAAEAFCGDYIQGSAAAGRCTGVPGVDIQASQIHCSNDVMVSTGNSTVLFVMYNVQCRL